jgi:hypothetical protein
MRIVRANIMLLLFSLIFAVAAFPQKTVSSNPGVAPLQKSLADSGSPLPAPVPNPPISPRP